MIYVAIDTKGYHANVFKEMPSLDVDDDVFRANVGNKTSLVKLS